MMPRMYPAAMFGVLVVLFLGAVSPARAHRLEGSVGAGLVVARGFSELKQRPTVGADATHWWAPTTGLELGLQMGGDVTSFPYGNADGEPDLGNRSGYAPSILTESITLMPRLLFGARRALGESAGLALYAGPTFLVSEQLGLFSIIPHPTISLAVDIKFGAGSRFGIRAGVSYLYFWLATTPPSFVTPSLALTW
jgi:hypothetical protein